MHQANSKAFDVTHKSVFAIVIPVTIASMTTPLIGIADTAVVGRLGDATLLGGLAVAAILFDLIFGSLNFLRSGTLGLTAQAVGAHNTTEQFTVLNRAILFSTLIGLIFIFLSNPLLTAGLAIIKPSLSVASAVTIYFSIRIFSSPFTFINYSILGWLLGLGQARYALVLQIVANAVNIILSIYLGLYKGFGIQGVAWATVISEVIATLIGAFLVWSHTKKFIWTGWQNLLNKQSLKRTFSLNRDLLIRTFILLFAFGFFTAQGSRLGDITLAANAVLFNFFLLSAYILDGFATASEQLVGRAVGARYQPAFDRAVRISLLWSAILAGILFILIMLFGPSFIHALTTHIEVQNEAKTYLIWAALSGIFGVLAFQMDGVYIGATWSREMRNMMILSLFIYLAAWWVLMPIWGNHGLWIAMEIFLGIRGITLLARLKVRRDEEFAMG